MYSCLQAPRMAHAVTSGRARASRPRRPASVAAIAGIEAQPADCEKGMTVFGIDCHPIPFPTPAKVAKAFRGHRRAKQSGSDQYVRNRTGTVVTTVRQSRMPPTALVGFPQQTVPRRDDAMHFRRRVPRRDGQAVADDHRLAVIQIVAVRLLRAPPEWQRRGRTTNEGEKSHRGGDGTKRSHLTK